MLSSSPSLNSGGVLPQVGFPRAVAMPRPCSREMRTRPRQPKPPPLPP
ncbi:hypothetical protein E2C01_093507 [Portunus trituberculatus]|uniref:Uncharacterized protein n=1 Tax=Portunus trituberculatus TaxID=210409 RepID=A0A5B7K0M4_PORTR|nr:hypothetical protein [Portunus trituberculatus]